MSDYTKVFDGAAKDSANATVLGADHDSEFALISAAIASKSDKPTGSTAGNIAQLDANGNIVDSGIDSADLDSLSSNVQAQLTAITPPANIANHVVAGPVQLRDASGGASAYNIHSALAEDTWATFGPTGSTHELTIMDAYPASATIGLFSVYASCQTNSTAAVIFNLYAAKGGVTPAVDDSNSVIQIYYDPNVSGYTMGMGHIVMIPLDANLRFQLYYALVDGNTATDVCHITPVGFIAGAT